MYSLSRLCECSMERLRSLGIDPNIPRKELSLLLSIQSTDVLLNLRQVFFEDLVSKDLGNEGDELVSRRSGGSRSLSVKLSEDICSLLYCFKNNSHIPRSIIKNGKRDKKYMEASRALSQSQASSSSQPATLINAPLTNQSISDRIALSSVMKELNTLKETVSTLKSEVSSLYKVKQVSRAPSTCHVSITCKVPCTAQELPSLLGCPVLNAVHVGAGLSWKVKIEKHCLYDALRSTSEKHSVRIWKTISLSFHLLLHLSRRPLVQCKGKYLLLHGTAEVTTTVYTIFMS